MKPVVFTEYECDVIFAALGLFEVDCDDDASNGVPSIETVNKLRAVVRIARKLNAAQA